jgi:hypothetical protein
MGIRPNLDLFRYYYSVKKELTLKKGLLANCGSITFKFCSGWKYPFMNHHEFAPCSSARCSSGGS